jgi:hypothetical protein
LHHVKLFSQKLGRTVLPLRRNKQEAAR